MRVLLVNTNRMKPPIAPIGLDYVSDSVRAAGHETRLLDLCLSDDIERDIALTMQTFQPEAIGISVRNTDDCYFSSGDFFLPGVRRVVELLRCTADLPIVMGGVGFSMMPEAVMDYCGVDYGIAGEGEDALVRLLAAWQGAEDLGRVPGLVCRRDGVVHRNPVLDLSLDRLPPRSRSLVDNVRYFTEGGQAGFETKRGCSMQCIYCADPVAKGNRIRLRDPRLVVEELTTLLARGIDHFHTCDCEFNLPGEHAAQVCQAIIEAGLHDRIRWFAYCAVTPFDDEMARLFRRAGCAGIDFGADSGSAEVLRRLGRHFGPNDLVRTARACRGAGIPFMLDLLVGGPGETRDTVRQTFDLARQVGADCVGVSMGVRVYAGTPLADLVRHQGAVDSNPDLYGRKRGNPDMLEPVFYISPDLGPEIVQFVRTLVGKDDRFFLPSAGAEETNYNYNDNSVLVRAIERGARGAYWDILRRLRCEGGCETTPATNEPRT